ncbi:MAG: UDP-N-acetylmuramate--L-alanine ligase [Candidatus Falkowbacteria bacterium]
MGMLNLNNVNKIFICGIGGIGTSALGRMFKGLGKVVIGSDIVSSEITDGLLKEGINVEIGQRPENISAEIGLLIYSDAVPETNPERSRAKELNILQMSFFEALGLLTRQKKTIAIAGTNGKSSTTAMISQCMIDAQMEPSIILGSLFPKIGANYRYGKSDWFVAEACEYRAHFLHLSPWAIILTNIEEEHMDFFTNMAHVLSVYQAFVNKIDPNGILIINRDDINIRKLRMPHCKVFSFGASADADARIKNLRHENGLQKFNVIFQGRDLGEFILNIPGRFYLYNALAAITFCLAINVPLGILKKAIADYKGIWRRFEMIKNDDIAVISDYGHHPTAVAGTIETLKQAYPLRRLVVVFQPHQYDRTKKLFKQFVESLQSADVLVLPEVYDVVGREENKSVGSKDLADAVKKEFGKREVYYCENLERTVEKVNSMLRKGDVVLVMGAGDVYTVATKLRIL